MPSTKSNGTKKLARLSRVDGVRYHFVMLWKPPVFKLLIAVATAALLGLVLTQLTKAATYIKTAEAEQGTLTGNYFQGDTQGASGGGSVRFGATSTTPPTGYTVTLTDFGAVCDGSTNDQPALQAAINDVQSKGGGTVVVPSRTCRILQTGSIVSTSIRGSVRVQGATTASTLTMDTDVPTAYRELFHIEGGSNISFDTLTIKRLNNAYAVLFNIFAVDGLTFNNVVVDGQKTSAGGNDIHGIAILGTTQTAGIRNVRMTGTTWKNLDFGMFQSSNSPITVDGWTVDNSTFSGNWDDDLEFNAPNSAMSNISVTNSNFTNNRASDTSAPSGFAIGFANVQTGLMKNNTISGYQFDPIHIEDRSSNITVDGNKISSSFLSGATNYASHIFVINQSHHITITNNIFDTSANTNRLDCIYLGQGGGAGVVHDVDIHGNTFKLKANASAVGQYGASAVTIGQNTTISL